MTNRLRSETLITEEKARRGPLIARVFNALDLNGDKVCEFVLSMSSHSLVLQRVSAAEVSSACSACVFHVGSCSAERVDQIRRSERIRRPNVELSRPLLQVFQAAHQFDEGKITAKVDHILHQLGKSEAKDKARAGCVLLVH